MEIITLAAAAFALCTQAPRSTCVVDGDTFWLEGKKVRLADINAPETTGAACPAQLVGRLRHFAARRAMDVEGLGERLCACLPIPREKGLVQQVEVPLHESEEVVQVVGEPSRETSQA